MRFLTVQNVIQALLDVQNVSKGSFLPIIIRVALNVRIRIVQIVLGLMRPIISRPVLLAIVIIL